MSKETILVVDDEEDIVSLIKFNLQNEGYKVLTALTGERAVEISRMYKPDLLVLDWMLPGIDGLEVTRCLRNNDSKKHIPIIMLTAKADESDIVTGLESGANDYMTKPFSPKELIARIRAILRRRNKKMLEFLEQPETQEGLVIDHGRHRVTIDGRFINLTPAEFELLSFLAGSRGWVFTRGQIVDAIHGDNYAVTDRSVDVVVVGLRKKLGAYAHLVETVRGIGYRYKEEIIPEKR